MQRFIIVALFVAACGGKQQPAAEPPPPPPEAPAERGPPAAVTGSLSTEAQAALEKVGVSFQLPAGFEHIGGVGDTPGCEYQFAIRAAMAPVEARYHVREERAGDTPEKVMRACASGLAMEGDVPSEPRAVPPEVAKNYGATDGIAVPTSVRPEAGQHSEAVIFVLRREGVGYLTTVVLFGGTDKGALQLATEAALGAVRFTK